MSRAIIVDSDTSIGYNYLIKKYFITNKNITTYRESATESKRVLDIVAPNNSITVEQLTILAEDFETLKSLSYTLSDTGSNITTIQINDYTEYPIELNVENKKLYIRNTNLVFDLTLNEARSSRVAILQAYYKEHLGLNISSQELLLIYNLLISTYTPSVYNLILDTSTTPIYYSNSFACSNFNNKGKLTYQCDFNPYGEFIQETIANIVNVNSSLNSITLSASIPSILKVGDKVIVKNATTVQDTYSYSADGEYTIKSIDTNTNTLYTNEPVQGSYTYNYPLASLVTTSTEIAEISRDTSTITLESTVPYNIQVGDIIYVTGTQQEIEGESVTCDGEYIVGSIENNTIVVQTPPPTNYTRSTGEYPILSKRLTLGNIESISSSTEPNTYNITFIEEPLQPLSVNAQFVIVYNNTETFYSIEEFNNNTIKGLYLSGTLTSYNVQYPILQIPVSKPNFLISITTSTNEAIMPVGEFMVDNFTQCQEYIGLLAGSIIPPNSVYTKLGQEIGESISIEGLPEITFLGIYSQVYTTEN